MCVKKTDTTGWDRQRFKEYVANQIVALSTTDFTSATFELCGVTCTVATMDGHFNLYFVQQDSYSLGATNEFELVDLLYQRRDGAVS